MRTNKFFLILACFILFALTVSAQDAEGPGAGFGLGMTIGVDTFNTASGESETFQTLALNPDLAIGDFGIGLDLVLHYRFVPPESNGGSSFDIREEDWIPMNGQSVLDLYLPKISYVRYGYKGDSLYVKYGQIDDATLGTGFVVNRYSNTLFKPDLKMAGLNFDLDGNLFDFPYLGIETFLGNIAHPDVLGGRIYARPLIWSGIPIVGDLEWGITIAADIDPDYRSEYFDAALLAGAAEASPVIIMGSDLILPVLGLDFFNLAVFGDLVFQPKAIGSMVGFGGRIIGIIPYVFQIRFLGDNFIPSYFDTSYDIYRGAKYAVVNSSATLLPGSVSWMATTGISLFEDMLSFSATVSGPFKAIPDGTKESNNAAEYPHFYGRLNVADGLVPNFSFSASYDKKYISAITDLIDARDALINMAVNYNAGAAVITLSYDVKYIPDTNPDVTAADFNVNSSLSCSLKLF